MEREQIQDAGGRELEPARAGAHSRRTRRAPRARARHRRRATPAESRAPRRSARSMPTREAARAPRMARRTESMVRPAGLRLRWPGGASAARAGWRRRRTARSPTRCRG
jgi:hypothetical protein